MKKLSNLKKVQLLEEKVLQNDTEGVITFLKEQSPIEFTAQVLGLACRFCGAEMVEALIQGGATFKYEFTPVMKQKYKCRIVLSNYNDIPVHYELYLLSAPEDYENSNTVIPDEERVKVLDVLIHNNMGDLNELLYYSIMYNDSVIYERLRQAGVNKLTDSQTDIISGRVPMNQMYAEQRYYCSKYIWFLQSSDIEHTRMMMERFLACMDVEKIHLFPSVFTSITGIKDCVSKFCSEQLFDLFISKTDMTEMVSKKRMVYAIADQNNLAALKYAINERWLNTPKDYEMLLTYLNSLENADPELVSLVSGQLPPKEEIVNKKRDPLSASELRKIWNTGKLEDGTLMITLYKGNETNVVIPSMIGKNKVTAISPNAFHHKAIKHVVFPGTIQKIPSDMFYAADKSGLTKIELCEGLTEICDNAFKGCSGLKKITLPESIQKIGEFAFCDCTSLKEIIIPSHITELPRGVFQNTGFRSFEIDDRFTSIGSGIFAECKYLKSVKLPNSMTAIPLCMFDGCVSLQSIDFPAKVSAIEEYAFAGSGLTKCEIPSRIKKIGDGAFFECMKLKELSVPPNTILGESVFNNCKSLADKNGAIISKGVLYGFSKSEEGCGEMPPEIQIKPLIIEENISRVAVSIDKIPLIVCRKYTGEGSTVNVNMLSVGDRIEFGRFPKDDSYVMKPLKWTVLAKEKGKVLLMTVNEIISLDYNVRQRNTWADSYVRKMLNKGFINVAFTEKERTQIITSTIITPDNKKYNIEGGPNTKDKVFLLSIEEVEKYLPTISSRKATPTKYALKQRPGKDDYGYWQLRTPGKDWCGAVAVDEESGDFSWMTGNHGGLSYIRPALWIKSVEQ